MVIVIGEAEAAPGRRDQLLEAAAAVAAATQGDPGCVHYGFSTDVSRPEVVRSVEVWTDRAALEAHLGHDHTDAFLAAVDGLVAGAPRMQFFDAAPTDGFSR